jgi:hypothetical protein
MNERTLFYTARTQPARGKLTEQLRTAKNIVKTMQFLYKLKVDPPSEEDPV